MFRFFQCTYLEPEQHTYTLNAAIIISLKSIEIDRDLFQISVWQM